MYTADPTARVWEDGRLYLYPSAGLYQVQITVRGKTNKIEGYP